MLTAATPPLPLLLLLLLRRGNGCWTHGKIVRLFAGGRQRSGAAQRSPATDYTAD